MKSRGGQFVIISNEVYIIYTADDPTLKVIPDSYTVARLVSISHSYSRDMCG
jgi:hypothetical protein